MALDVPSIVHLGYGILVRSEPFTVYYTIQFIFYLVFAANDEPGVMMPGHVFTIEVNASLFSTP
jgi:hypothetical protein